MSLKCWWSGHDGIPACIDIELPGKLHRLSGDTQGITVPVRLMLCKRCHAVYWEHGRYDDV